MQQFDNYVFDLYGTLVDIHTDENQPHLWVHMADLYRVYGADWTAEELERAFRAYEKEAREKQAERMGTAYPEIQYEDLLIRCLKSAPRTHETAMPISARASEAAIRAAFWPEFMANDFRAVSRSRFLLYPGTLETLRELKARGRRLYLLSNAQAVFTLPEMEMMGLAPLFDRMHMSSWDGMMKPEPRYLRRLLEEEGLDREKTCMVGNEFACDMGMALKCGVTGVFLDSGNHERKELERIAKEMTDQYPGGQILIPPAALRIRALLEEH